MQLIRQSTGIGSWLNTNGNKARELLASTIELHFYNHDDENDLLKECVEELINNKLPELEPEESVDLRDGLINAAATIFPESVAIPFYQNALSSNAITEEEQAGLTVEIDITAIDSNTVALSYLLW